MARRWTVAVSLLGASLLVAPAVRAKLPADAPELAARGAFPVGTQSLTLIDPDRVDVLHPDNTGGFKHYARLLPIEIWYPAVSAATHAQHVTYTMPAPFLSGLSSGRTMPLSFAGEAARCQARHGAFPFGGAISWLQ